MGGVERNWLLVKRCWASFVVFGCGFSSFCYSVWSDLVLD